MANNNNQTGGYNSDFVDKLPERLMCNICTKPLRDPYLVVCCGQHYCHSCLNSWLKNAHSCPHCRAAGNDFQHVINKSLKREILAQRVKCQHYHEGCYWIGELGSMNDHLESANGCGYVEVECTNKCTKVVTWVPKTRARIKIKRKDLSKHLQESCCSRDYLCEYCGQKGKYEEITGTRFNSTMKNFHYKTCPEMPICCPNKCSTDQIKRKDIENHRTHCPLETIECPNGCKTNVEGKSDKCKMLRKDLDKHLKDECYLRPYKCKYCNLESTYEGITGKGTGDTITQATNHYSKCPEFPLPCPNSCGVLNLIKRKNMIVHRLHCPEETVQCPNECVQKARGMKRKDLDKHVTDECLLRQHKCTHCGKRDTYTAITKHYNTCSNYPLECPNNCGAKRIMRKNITLHCDKCPQQPVECPFAEAGCKIKLIRQKLEKHNSTMQEQHLDLMMGAFKEMKQHHKKELQKIRDEQKRDLTQARTELREVKSELTQTKQELRQMKTELQDTKRSLSQCVIKKPRQAERRPRRYDRDYESESDTPWAVHTRQRSGWSSHEQYGYQSEYDYM